LNIQTTGEIDCATYWNTLKGKNIVQGKSSCEPKKADPTSLNGTSTSSSSGSKSSDTKGAAASYGISGTVAGLSVVGAMLHMLL